MKKLHYQPDDSQIKADVCWKCGRKLVEMSFGGVEDTIHVTHNEGVWKDPPGEYESCEGKIYGTS